MTESQEQTHRQTDRLIECRPDVCALVVMRECLRLMPSTMDD